MRCSILESSSQVTLGACRLCLCHRLIPQTLTMLSPGRGCSAAPGTGPSRIVRPRFVQQEVVIILLQPRIAALWLAVRTAKEGRPGVAASNRGQRTRVTGRPFTLESVGPLRIMGRTAAPMVADPGMGFVAEVTAAQMSPVVYRSMFSSRNFVVRPPPGKEGGKLL